MSVLQRTQKALKNHRKPLQIKLSFAFWPRRIFSANQRVQLEENYCKCSSVIGRNQPTRPGGTRGLEIDKILSKSHNSTSI